MKDAKDLIPWKVTDISIRPFDGMWSFNPSIHFDGELWRCVMRNCDYAMPNGVTIRSSKAGPGHQSKNAMVIFDPNTWKPIRIYKMHERDDTPRTACANVGFEDMRIFKTDRGGLQGIAASLHLKRDDRPKDGSQHQPPEQVLLSFDGDYNIVAARSIRGDWWSGTPQKNWVPFDHCAEPRFLYSIDKGTMFDDRGAIHGSAAAARPSANSRPVPANLQIVQAKPPSPEPPPTPSPQEAPREREQERDLKRKDRDSSPKSDRRSFIRGIRGTEVQMVRGRRVVADTLTSRPSSSKHVRARGMGARNESARALGTGRTLLPKYDGLRGGTQLVRVGDDAWLGIGHEMRFVKSLKYYWHTWYLVDSKGKMKAASQQMKLVPSGIEFAAGMAIDGDRVVVSFGVDDMESKLGGTSLSAVLGILQPVER